MGSKPFQFKQFSVNHDRSIHKVGTDAVLLGAWVNIHENQKSFLDIGTGSGILALMMAQRTSYETHIDAVEIEAQDARQARENFAHSPWSHRISLHHTPLQEFEPGKQFDLIITNPPYFVNSLTPPDERRSRARHAQHLTFNDLLESASRLLSSFGRFALILPAAEEVRFLTLARQFKLFPLRKTTFRARAHKPAERLLIELAYEGTPEAASEIILYADGESWSSDYKKLTADFYLRI
jgi:tRNA1Val (adenine37-N6)-methyltransferase